MADLVYLLVRSKNSADMAVKLIPLVVVFLIWLGLSNWARNVIGHPLGIGLVVGILLYIVVIILGCLLEFFALKQLVADFLKALSLITHWRTADLKTWLALTMVIPLTAHILVAVWHVDANRQVMMTNREVVPSRILTVAKLPLEFCNDRDLQYYKDSRQSLVKEGKPCQKARLKVGGTEILFTDILLSFYRTQAVQMGFLAEDTAIGIKKNKVLFSTGGSIEFYPTGGIKEGTLAEPTIFQLAKQGRRMTLPAGAEVSFYADGSLREFFYPHTDSEWLTGSGETVRIKKSDTGKLSLYQDGSIKFGCLAQDTTFVVQGQNIPCQADTPVEFYPDGSLKRGNILREMILPLGGGREAKLAPGTEVLFSLSGVLVGVDLGEQEGYLNPDGEMIAVKAHGSYLYNRIEFMPIYRDTEFYVHYTDPRRVPDFSHLEEKVKIDAVGYFYGDAIEILEQNEIMLAPGQEDFNLLVMFRYANPKTETIREILFMESMTIYYRDKQIACPAFTWVKVSPH